MWMFVYKRLWNSFCILVSYFFFFLLLSMFASLFRYFDSFSECGCVRVPLAAACRSFKMTEQTRWKIGKVCPDPTRKRSASACSDFGLLLGPGRNDDWNLSSGELKWHTNWLDWWSVCYWANMEIVCAFGFLIQVIFYSQTFWNKVLIFLVFRIYSRFWIINKKKIILNK